MSENSTKVPVTQCFSSNHIIFILNFQKFATRKARNPRPAGQSQNDHDVNDGLCLHHCNNRYDKKHSGKGNHYFNHSLDDNVNHPAIESCQCPQNHTNEYIDCHSYKSHQQTYSGTVNHLGQYIPAQFIGSKNMRSAGWL